uniref:Inositol-tetrakisphosphate 1-kinase n=1 Tax=Strigamia maritima TaxID=126957 RepID=T1IPY5_STRMM
INLSKPLQEQGPFSAILHKLTDVIVKAEALTYGKNESANEDQKILSAFEAYLTSNPDILVIDPIDSVRTLIDRSKTYRLIDESPLAKEDGVIRPAFVELTTCNTITNLKLLKEYGVSFPFICKPSLAHGSQLAHKMAIIFNEEGVKDITPPCVAQTFICHNAILYKLFAIGDSWYVVERPSLKNFHAGDQETIFFDSHDVSKANSVSSLNQLDEADLLRLLPKPCFAQFQKIMTTVHKILRMALFGVDVVIENKTGKYAIIDINVFPGRYDGVPNFFEVLCRYTVGELERRKTSTDKLDTQILLTESNANNQEDSGIDTGDSSDEKKHRKSIKAVRRQHQRTSSSTYAHAVAE